MTKFSRSDWREGFLFLGNHLCLDFVNTRPVLNNEPKELLRDWASLIRWFGAAELIDQSEAASFEGTWAQSDEAQKVLEAIWAFRENLRKDLLVWQKSGRLFGKTVRQLNELMSTHPMLSKIKSDHSKPALVEWFPLRRPCDLFAPLASAAANLFSQLNPERVRRCEHCVLHFHDTSKIGNRRWCSMRLCGNRAKVAAHTSRHKST